MKKSTAIVGGVLCFSVGYYGGSVDSTVVDERTVEKVIDVRSEFLFPNSCFQAITYGTGTNFSNERRLREFDNLADECFDTLSLEGANLSRVVEELPPDRSIVVPSDNYSEEYTEEEIDNAFLDCVDETFDREDVEEYCDENYEDWLG